MSLLYLSKQQVNFVCWENFRLKNSIKILFDHQTFDVQKVGGISRYFSGLLDYFKNLEGSSYELSIKKSNNIYLTNINQFDFQPIADSYKKFAFGIDFKGKYRLYNWYKKYFSEFTSVFQDENIQESIRLLKLNEFDIFQVMIW